MRRIQCAAPRKVHRHERRRCRLSERNRGRRDGQRRTLLLITPTCLEKLTLADGTSNTIALVESTDAVIWTKPDEILIEQDEAPIPSLGAIPNSPYFIATHFDGANHLYKRVSGSNPVINSWYYRLLRQMIGWKDGFNLDPSSILVR